MPSMQIANNSAIRRFLPAPMPFMSTPPLAVSTFFSFGKFIDSLESSPNSPPLTLPNKQISIIGRRYYYFDQWIQAQKSILNEPS
jgi:hypothetical protein